MTLQTWHDQFKQFASKSPQKSIENSSQTGTNIYIAQKQNGLTKNQQNHQLSPPATVPFFSTYQPHRQNVKGQYIVAQLIRTPVLTVKNHCQNLLGHQIQTPLI